MKVIFKNTNVVFQKAPQPGDEVKINLDSTTGEINGESALHAVGSGYYLSSTGGFVHLDAYDNKATWVSNTLSTEGYSKIKLVASGSLDGINLNHNQIRFNDANGYRIGNADGFFNHREEASMSAESPYFVIDIPSAAVNIQFGSNTNSSGTLVCEYDAYFIV